VPFTATFSKNLDLQAVSTNELTAIVGALNETAHAIDTIPRRGAMWCSLTLTPLTTKVQGWTVEYKIDIDEEKLIVISLWR